MTVSQPSSSLQLSTPHSSPMLQAQRDRSESGQYRRRKRRLTAPPDLQLGEAAAQARSKKARISHVQDEVKIIEDVDELIPRLRAMGEDTSTYTPQSGGVDSAFLPFVFDDGVLSFYTPADSPEVSDPDYGASLPSSAISASFPGASPHEPYHDTRRNHGAVLQGLSIWQGDDNGPTHIYTQTLDRYPTRETTYLNSLDPSLMRYGPVHTAIAQLACQFTHVDIPLTAPSSTNGNKFLPNSSIVTVSSLRRSPMRLLTALYSQGTLLSSWEAQMEQRDHLHSEATSYSAPFPQEMIDELCNDVCKALDGDSEKNTPSDDITSRSNYLDSIIVMRFVQEENLATGVEETALVVAGEFHAIKSSSPAEVKISCLAMEDGPQVLHVPEAFLPTPPSSSGHVSNHPESSRFLRLPRPLGRSIPKLSVAIPPPTMHGVGGIQLCTDSPGLTPDSIARPTPRTGIPDNVFPVTPFEQLIRTPHSPPEIQRSTRSRPGYAPTPTESAYPFTLASTSPGPAPSPAFGVLDSGSGLGSAPAWLTGRNVTPFTPSFFMQHPHTASASSTMISLTQGALDVSTPASLRGHECSVSSLASPLPIVSAPPFSISVSREDGESSDPAKTSHWPCSASGSILKSS